MLGEARNPLDPACGYDSLGIVYLKSRVSRRVFVSLLKLLNRHSRSARRALDTHARTSRARGSDVEGYGKNWWGRFFQEFYELLTTRRFQAIYEGTNAREPRK